MRLFNLAVIVLGASYFMYGCASTKTPPGITPVTPFDAARYSGKWYEIARLDHRFEKGLSRVTAEYTPNPDGSIKVVNRGYSEAKQKWKESVGRAIFVKNPNTAHLKVSFFGPFYGGYIVYDLDPQYRYALVSGPKLSYLWILSRTPTIDDSLKQELIQKAKNAGFDTSKLVMVKQDQ